MSGGQNRGHALWRPTGVQEKHVCVFVDGGMTRELSLFSCAGGGEEGRKWRSGAVKVCGVDIQVPSWLKYSSKLLTLGLLAALPLYLRVKKK